MDAANKFHPPVLQDSLHGALLTLQRLGTQILGLLPMNLEQPLYNHSTTRSSLFQVHPQIIISTEELVEGDSQVSLPTVVVEVDCLCGV